MRNYLKSTRKRSAQIIPSLMILPYVCFMFFCGIIPIAYGILEVRNPSWVNMDGGYETFLKVLQDFRVGPALINVFFYNYNFRAINGHNGPKHFTTA